MYHIIINPASHSGSGQKLWKHYEPTFDALKEQYQIHYSEKPGDITKICRSLTAPAKSGDASPASSPVKIVVFGGDGSINEAVNGIEDFSNVLFGMIPIGSGNDLAKDLIPDKTDDELIGSILKGNELRSIDIGEILYNDSDPMHPGPDSEEGCAHRFAVSCGFGYDAAICEEVNDSAQKSFLNAIRLGKLSYLFVAVHQIFTAPMCGCRIIFDPETEKERICEHKHLLFAVGMNHRFEGGGFQFCPHAKADDGMLDFCTVSDIFRGKFFYAFPFAYSGNHLRFKGILEDRAETVRMISEQYLWVHTDGETLRRSRDITMRLLPCRLKLMI